MRDEIASKDYSCTINEFSEMYEKIADSKLHKALNSMPKGGIHHIHSTATIPVESFLDITREDFVYYNDREKLLKCYPNYKDIDPYYVKCN